MKDLHCHLPFGISDGPREIAESLEMLRIAAESGVTHINAVAHYTPGRREALERAVDALREAASRHSIHLNAGFEYSFLDLLDVREPFLTVGEGSRSILVDFEMETIPAFAPMRFYEIMRKETRIILVHPEVLFTRSAIPLLTQLAHMNVTLMLNAASFLHEAPHSVRKMAHHLLHAGLAHAVASDAHATEGPRRYLLREARKAVTRWYGPENARILFDVNPDRILENLRPYDLNLSGEPFWKKWLPV